MRHHNGVITDHNNHTIVDFRDSKLHRKKKKKKTESAPFWSDEERE